MRIFSSVTRKGGTVLWFEMGSA